MVVQESLALIERSFKVACEVRQGFDVDGESVGIVRQPWPLRSLLPHIGEDIGKLLQRVGEMFDFLPKLQILSILHVHKDVSDLPSPK